MASRSVANLFNRKVILYLSLFVLEILTHFACSLIKELSLYPINLQFSKIFIFILSVSIEQRMNSQLTTNHLVHIIYIIH